MTSATNKLSSFSFVRFYFTCTFYPYYFSYLHTQPRSICLVCKDRPVEIGVLGEYAQMTAVYLGSTPLQFSSLSDIRTWHHLGCTPRGVHSPRKLGIAVPFCGHGFGGLGSLSGGVSSEICRASLQPKWTSISTPLCTEIRTHGEPAARITIRDHLMQTSGSTNSW